MAGKGSNPRPVDATKYRENWDRIFDKVQEERRRQWRADQLLDEALSGDNDALAELTQLSQDMGMYPPVIDEHGHQDLT